MSDPHEEGHDAGPDAPNNVYLVTAGDYSDYHVVAAFSSMELAEAFRARLPRPHDAWIQSYPLDAGHRWGHLVTVLMARDGRVLNTYRTWGEVGQSNYRLLEFYKGQERRVLCVDAQTEDEESAVKTCNETRAQLIAANIWPADE